MEQEPKAKRTAPWYADKTELYEALTRAFGGYRGKVEQRWHVIPLALTKSKLRFVKGLGHKSYLLTKEAGLATPDDDHIKKRIRRMWKQCLPDYDEDVIDEFKYIMYDAVDATVAVFPFEMVYFHGDGDGNTGFFATVWDRNTGKEVAHCDEASDSETAIVWKDKEIVRRFVPHEGLFPEVDEDKFVNDEDSCFFQEISPTYSGIHTTHGNGKNQLELMIAVAGELTLKKNAVFFPSRVPDDVMAEAKTYLMGKLIALFTPDVVALIWSYLEWRIFLDHDAVFPLPSEDDEGDY